MTAAFLYIDPGTGSMLFSLFMALATTAVFVGRELFIRLKFVLSGGRAKKTGGRIPIVIYSDHKRYWNVFKPVCDEAERRGVDIVYYTQSADDPALSEPYTHIRAEFIGEGNKGFAKLNFLKADVVLATTPGLDVYQWRRSRDVGCYVHIPHTVDDLSGYRMFGLEFYDVVLATGRNQVELVRELEGLRPTVSKKELVIVGSPNLDSMCSRRSFAPASSTNDQISILVAPSWGKSGILSRYGERLLSCLSKTGYKVIVRPHPQTVVSEQDILKGLEEKFAAIEWNYDLDNFDVLNRADVLITDFSGIIFDYSLVFDKPLIYADTDFDPAPYDAAWLDKPMWSFRVLPKLGVSLKQEELEKIGNVVSRILESPALKEGREAVRRECWEHIGGSSGLIVDYLTEKQKELER